MGLGFSSPRLGRPGPWQGVHGRRGPRGDEGMDRRQRRPVETHFENNYFTEMCSGSEAGSYLRRIDFCITQL